MVPMLDVLAEQDLQNSTYRTFSTILLEKTEPHGEVPVGTVFQYTYKSKARDQALQAASKMLEFQYRGESRLNWKEIR